MTEPLVLCYHTIAAADHSMAVSADQFEWQISKLLRRGYTVTTVSEALRSEHRGRVVAITFDDGFRSVWDVAYPVLRGLGVPATVFPATRFLFDQTRLSWPAMDQHGSLPAEELLPLSTAHVRALVDEGWELGSHTTTHPYLPSLRDDRLAAELRQSREDCQEIAQSQCDVLAYPFGGFDRRVADAARAAGYRYAMSLAWSTTGMEDMAVPRVAVYNGDHRLRYLAKTCRALHVRPGRDVANSIQRRREAHAQRTSAGLSSERDTSLTAAAEAP